MADTFFGASLTLATSGETFQILEGSKDASTVETFETTHTGTSGSYKTKGMTDMIDGGSYSFTVILDPDTDETNFLGVSQTCTVTYPVPTGLTNGATWAFTGGIVEYGQELPMDDKMTAEISVSVNGAITITAAS